MLEQNGIATVVMGCAKDIVEYVGVPRFLFSDFPLGNAAGRPRDPHRRTFTLDLALDLLESAPAPRTTVQSPLHWSESPDVEARLLQRRPPAGAGDRAAPRRIRATKGSRQGGARRHLAAPRTGTRGRFGRYRLSSPQER